MIDLPAHPYTDSQDRTWRIVVDGLAVGFRIEHPDGTVQFRLITPDDCDCHLA